MTRMARKMRPRIEIDFVSLSLPILHDYHALLTGAAALEEEGAVKALSNRHAAGKVVLSHLELLLKLAMAQAESSQPGDIHGSLAEYRSLMPRQVTEELQSDDEGDGG